MSRNVAKIVIHIANLLKLFKAHKTNFNTEIFISYIIVAEIIFPEILFVLILALFKLKPYFDLFISQIAEANKISVKSARILFCFFPVNRRYS